MKSENSEKFLSQFDEVLLPLGFVRSKKDQLWERKSLEANFEYVHLNFGKYVVNPSLGVRYADLENLSPPAGVISSSKMLKSLVEPSPQYSSDSPINLLIDDVTSIGIPYLQKLNDRQNVIEKLRSPNIQDWPVTSYSHRIRLLPLLLHSVGEYQEAKYLVAEFKGEAKDKDQLIPSFDDFAEWLDQQGAT